MVYVSSVVAGSDSGFIDLMLGKSILITGLSTLAFSLSWLWPEANRVDRKFALAINRLTLPGWVDRILNVARWYGTKWVFWPVLLGLIAYFDQMSVLWLLLGLATTLLERRIKSVIRRPRPFVHDRMVIMRQNPRPLDDSYPSGDATRVWFITTAAFALGDGGIGILLISLGLAGVISVGRIRMGVHHPLDVLAGIGLGLVGGWFGAWI